MHEKQKLVDGQLASVELLEREKYKHSNKYVLKHTNFCLNQCTLLVSSCVSIHKNSRRRYAF